MDDEAWSCELPALEKYVEALDSTDQTDLAFYRELAVREEGERLHCVLDCTGVSATDPVRLKIARAAEAQRRLLYRLGSIWLEDELDLLDGEPN